VGNAFDPFSYKWASFSDQENEGGVHNREQHQ